MVTNAVDREKWRPDCSGRLVDIITSCLETRDDASIRQAMDWVRGISGSSAAIVVHFSAHRDGWAAEKLVNCGYDPGWVEEYAQEQYAKIDPVMQFGFTSPVPYTWATAYDNAPKLPKWFIESAKDVGLDHGCSYLVKGPQVQSTYTIVSLANSECLNADVSYVLRTLAPVFHEILFYQESLLSARHEVQLTDKEYQVLQWAAVGKSAWEIGLILAMSERTAKFHLQNIYRKLNVSNRTQAVAQAVRLGLV